MPLTSGDWFMPAQHDLHFAIVNDLRSEAASLLKRVKL